MDNSAQHPDEEKKLEDQAESSTGHVSPAPPNVIPAAPSDTSPATEPSSDTMSTPPSQDSADPAATTPASSTQAADSEAHDSSPATPEKAQPSFTASQPTTPNYMTSDPAAPAGNSKKPLLILLVVLLLVGLGALGYFVMGMKGGGPAPVAVTPTKVPTPTVDPVTTWETYTNTINKYTIKHPKELIATETKTGITWFGKQISLAVVTFNPEECTGAACPELTTTEDATVGKQTVRKLIGTTTAASGTVQSFQRFVFLHNKKYYSLSAYELPSDATPSATRKAGAISDQALMTLEKMAGTLTFTDKTMTEKGTTGTPVPSKSVTPTTRTVTPSITTTVSPTP